MTEFKSLVEKSLTVVSIYNLILHQLLTGFLTGFREIDISVDLLVQIEFNFRHKTLGLINSKP